MAGHCALSGMCQLMSSPCLLISNFVTQVLPVKYGLSSSVAELTDWRYWDESHVEATLLTSICW